MIPGTDDLIPEGYDQWPQAIQQQYWRELYLIHFPEEAATGPGAKIIPLPRGRKRISRPRNPDGDAS